MPFGIREIKMRWSRWAIATRGNCVPLRHRDGSHGVTEPRAWCDTDPGVATCSRRRVTHSSSQVKQSLGTLYGRRVQRLPDQEITLSLLTQCDRPRSTS